MSAATLEHVGSWEEQLKFAHLIETIGDSYFVTTPNRWFPVEFHTFFTFMHGLPKKSHRSFLQHVFGNSFWAQAENLNLLGMKVVKLFAKNKKDTVHGFAHLLGIPSNHLIIDPHI